MDDETQRVDDTESSLTIEALADAAGVSRRAVRFYIQAGVLDRPAGTARGARYGRRHLQRLLDIRAWQDEGLTIEGIRRKLALPPAADRRPPTAVALWTRVTLVEGVEVHINPETAALNPDQVRRLTEAVRAAFHAIRTANEGDPR